MACRLAQIRILRNLKAASQFLRSKEGKQDHISVNATHENTHHKSVLIPLCLLAILRDFWRQGEASAELSLDRGGGGGGEITKLVGCTYDKSSEGAG